jgi:hypothetical protein
MPDPTQYGNFEPGHSIESVGRIAKRIDREMGKFGPFGEVEVAEISSVLAPKPTYEVSIQRDEIVEDGTKVDDPKDSTRVDTIQTGEYQLTNPANADAETIHQTARRGRYIPGFGARAGIAFRREESDVPEGNQVIRWGYYDDQDGFYFGEDTDGVFVARRKNQTESQKVYQENWNWDVLDGSDAETFRAQKPQNTSGFNLDLTNGHIFQIDYSWYGYGVIVFKVITWDEWNNQVPTIAHVMKVTGEPSVRDANLPLSYGITNNGTAVEKNAYVTGRSYQILGKYEPDYRSKSVDRIAFSVGTSWTPTISIRKKDAFQNVNISSAQYSFTSTENILFHWRLGTSLTGANFTTPQFIDPNETALEVDNEATDVTGGERLSGLNGVGGQGNKSSGTVSDPSLLELPDTQTATLVCRTVSGNADATVTANWVEEW